MRKKASKVRPTTSKSFYEKQVKNRLFKERAKNGIGSNYTAINRRNPKVYIEKYIYKSIYKKNQDGCFETNIHDKELLARQKILDDIQVFDGRFCINDILMFGPAQSNEFQSKQILTLYY